MYTQITTDFANTLNTSQKNQLSFVIDDIEQETAWETKVDILNILESQKLLGNLEEYLAYLISKPKPIR